MIIDDEKKALCLLQKLERTLTTIQVDMGGKHRYSMSHKSHDVITEIKAFLYEIYKRDNPY